MFDQPRRACRLLWRRVLRMLLVVFDAAPDVVVAVVVVVPVMVVPVVEPVVVVPVVPVPGSPGLEA